ncbi:hypothetical protein QOZ80_2AG0121180 [Eleusine coracana subsp. coracana]|nr:hypothetical protein QOZ80_2AG0121180 [Eleusine coracana subsp. coracana]
MSSSSGGGGGGGGPHRSATSSAASLPSTSPSSLDGRFLLHLLENPPPHARCTSAPAPGAPSESSHHIFVDPAVATVGPLFPASQQVQGGIFAWPTPSAPQAQQRLLFPDPRFAPSVDPRAARGGGGFGAADAVRADRPRPGAPPPGFGKVLHQSADNSELHNAFGGTLIREQNQHRPRGFDGKALNKELWTTESEPHKSIGGRTLRGDQHTPQIRGTSMFPRGLGHLNARLENMEQREIRWQGNREGKGHASGKLYDMYGKTPMNVKPAGSSVPVDVRNGLDHAGIRELGLRHVVDGEVVAAVKKSELSNQKSESRFVGQYDEDDDGKEHDVDQLTESLVISGDGGAKGMELQKTSLRSKDFRSDFSRGHHVSSQRIRLQRRNRSCRYDIDKFTPSFLSIFDSLVPSDEEITKQRQLCTTLSRLINQEWPDSKLFLYGSCANSFGFSNSDIDLCLSIDAKEMSKVDIILKLADILEAGNLQNIQALTRARVPIVKLMDPETGLSCDICVNNLLAVVNTKLLKDYALIDRRLRQLAFIVKHWAKSRRVNETYQGTLSSYAYVIMCIHLLQLRRILPCLQEMEATYYVTVDDNTCAYFDEVDKLNNYGAHNKDTVSRLLWAFFHYWAYEHDYTRDVISIRTGRIISKERKDWTRRVGNDRHLICIEDPFEISHDLGRVVDKFTIKILREEFERAANILQFDGNPSVTLFEPYVPPPMPSLVPEEMASTTEFAL